MKKQHPWLVMLLIAACCTTWVSRPAVAEVIVIDPSSDLYKIGQRLPDNPTLDIRECQTLALFTGKKFLELTGPYKGPLSAYKDAGRPCESYTPAHTRRAAPKERGLVYSHYFDAVCEEEIKKTNSCDATCKAVFQLLTNKPHLMMSECP